MRRVLGALRGDEQAELGPGAGPGRLAGLVDQMRLTGLEVDLRVEGESVPLPPPLDLAAYRVLQEGLTNVRKHAEARGSSSCFGSAPTPLASKSTTTAPARGAVAAAAAGSRACVNVSRSSAESSSPVLEREASRFASPATRMIGVLLADDQELSAPGSA